MIFLVRHGEAAASWGDHPDPGLSELGYKQSVAVGHQLGELGANALICSPMQRCQETAAPFAKHLGTQARIEPDVSEIITPDHIDDRVGWLRDLMGGNWPEEMLPWCQTARQTVEALPDGTAVFSHFVAINAIVGQLSGQPDVLVFKPGHCSVTVLERDKAGVLQVMKLGDEAATRIL